MKLPLFLSSLLLMLASCSSADSSPTSTYSTQVYQDIKLLDRMVLASMAITKTARIESTDWYKVGPRIALYSYDSYLRAYIDLSALSPDDISVDEQLHTVRLTLPPIRTEVVGRDMQMRKVYENIGLLRSELDSKERAEMKERANTSFKAEIEDNPAFRSRLVETARRKAAAYFESLFAAEGYTATIDFSSSSF